MRITVTSIEALSPSRRSHSSAKSSSLKRTLQHDRLRQGKKLALHPPATKWRFLMAVWCSRVSSKIDALTFHWQRLGHVALSFSKGNLAADAVAEKLADTYTARTKTLHNEFNLSIGYPIRIGNNPGAADNRGSQPRHPDGRW